MIENKKKLCKIIFITLILIICAIILVYQTKKQGFHEDEVYTITTSVNPYGGLMSAYSDKDTQTIMCERHIFSKNFFTEVKNAVTFIINNQDYIEEINEIDNNAKPIWRTNEEVKKNVTLTSENYFNLKALYYNQLKDTHPPFFYTLVHFSTILFGGQFTKYSVFLVNIISFVLSCFVIKKILKLLDKENLTIPILIFYGLSIGTITMVIYQRMYMVLTLFILLYFYYSIRIFKNDLKMTKELNFKLGITTVVGFLTQYYFAVYAFLIVLIMSIKMAKDKKYNDIFKYVAWHILYAIIGVLIFIPCLYHLFAERGLSNLSNSNYLEHFRVYVKYLAYAFTIKDNMLLIVSILIIFLGGIIYIIRKTKENFIILLTILPSAIYFLFVVKMTSYQEFRYIMPIIPFVALTLFIILDSIMKFKYKNGAMLILSIVLVLNGLVFSKPKFLFEEYKESLKIAEENNEKSFVYIYDNIFNHMQSVPEMMIYKKSIIINYNKGELQYIINSDVLNEEDAYILCIKTYMDNSSIVEEIKQNTKFKNITQIYFGPEASSEVISNNLYLVTK